MSEDAPSGVGIKAVRIERSWASSRSIAAYLDAITIVNQPNSPKECVAGSIVGLFRTW
jgi:hypothetical protein